MRNAITLPATATAQVVTLVTEIIIEPLPRTPTLAAQPEVTHKLENRVETRHKINRFLVPLCAVGRVGTTFYVTDLKKK